MFFALGERVGAEIVEWFSEDESADAEHKGGTLWVKESDRFFFVCVCVFDL